MIYVEEIEELVNAVCESGGITPLTLFAKATGNAHAYSAIRYKSGRITIRDSRFIGALLCGSLPRYKLA